MPFARFALLNFARNRDVQMLAPAACRGTLCNVNANKRIKNTPLPQKACAFLVQTSRFFMILGQMMHHPPDVSVNQNRCFRPVFCSGSNRSPVNRCSGAHRVGHQFVVGSCLQHQAVRCKGKERDTVSERLISAMGTIEAAAECPT